MGGHISKHFWGGILFSMVCCILGHFVTDRPLGRMEEKSDGGLCAFYSFLAFSTVALSTFSILFLFFIYSLIFVFALVISSILNYSVFISFILGVGLGRQAWKFCGHFCGILISIIVLSFLCISFISAHAFWRFSSSLFFTHFPPSILLSYHLLLVLPPCFQLLDRQVDSGMVKWALWVFGFVFVLNATVFQNVRFSTTNPLRLFLFPFYKPPRFSFSFSIFVFVS